MSTESEFLDRMLTSLGITRAEYDAFMSTDTAIAMQAAREDADIFRARYLEWATGQAEEISAQITRKLVAEGKLPPGAMIAFDDSHLTPPTVACSLLSREWGRRSSPPRREGSSWSV